MKRSGFPFAALEGLAKVRRALLIAAVSQSCRSVLISGQRGSGKSTAARSLRELAEGPWIEVPVSVTEDRLFGAVDTEAAMKDGKKSLLPGLLAEADGGILYIDDVNLFREELLLPLLDAEEAGYFRVERDGISAEHASHFTVLAVMDPEAGTLAPAALDRFGLFVQTEAIEDIETRRRIIRSVIDFERDAAAFRARYAEDTTALQERIRAARALLPSVEISDAIIQLAAVYTIKAYCAGHRADLYLIEAARAIAALAGRMYILPKDIEEAAEFVLPHRMRKPPETEPERQEETPEEEPEENERPEETQTEEKNDEPLPPPPEDPGERSDESAEENEREKKDEADSTPQGESRERVDSADLRVHLPPMMIEQGKDRKKRKGSGKRSATRTDLREGRYVRAEIPKNDAADIAFDATLRAAAPYQKARRELGDGSRAVYVEKPDLRSKVREKRVGNIFLFCVDASGSMGARERMKLVKGVVFRMLLDAYQKRDRVGMIAFRRKKAELLLPVTRSVDLAQKRLAAMPTGGKTPLAAGLAEAETVLDMLYRQDATQEPVLVLITDGRATSAAEKGGDPVAEALAVAKRLGKRKIPIAVIDTEQGFVRMGIARRLATAMGAAYYPMAKLSAEKIFRIARGAAEDM